MTTAEMNAAIAKAKGWTPAAWINGEPFGWLDADGATSHRNPTGDPREWSRLLEEMGGEIKVIFHSKMTRTVILEPGGPGRAHTARSLGEAVCRAYLAWKGVSDA